MRRRRGPHGAQLQLLDRRRRTQTGCQRGSVAPCPSSHHQQIWWHERSLRHVLGNRVVVGIACCRPCHYLRRSAGSAPSAPTPRRDLHQTSSLTGVAAAANRRRRGSAPATTTPRRPARGLQTGSSGGRSPAASERRPRQHRIRRATPSARAADAGVGLLAWRTRPTRRPETQPLAQSGEAVRRGGAERCRGTPLQRSAGRWRCLLHENAAVKNGRSTLLRCDLF